MTLAIALGAVFLGGLAVGHWLGMRYAYLTLRDAIRRSNASHEAYRQAQDTYDHMSHLYAMSVPNTTVTGCRIES